MNPPTAHHSPRRPRRNSGLCHVCTGGNSTKRRKKMGSSVAYKTIGTFLSQDKRHEDACGWATEPPPPPPTSHGDNLYPAWHCL